MHAVLLANLGTPASPNKRDVRRYLTEFLCDPRVIDLPWLRRNLLVRCAIVPKRLKRVSASYQAIWMEEGPPLRVYGERLAAKLQLALGEGFSVALGMRYPSSSLLEAADELLDLDPERLTVIPLFPQYASATVGSVLELLYTHLARRSVQPTLRVVTNYATNPAFITAHAMQAEPFDLARYDHFLFSFHGLPERQVRSGDLVGGCLDAGCCRRKGGGSSCYVAQCYATAEALASQISLDLSKMSVAFQSRLGKEPWLGPTTEETVLKLAKGGTRRLLLFSPSFVSDCLETTYELGVEAHDLFLGAGGEKLDLVPSLNSSDAWVEALRTMVK